MIKFCDNNLKTIKFIPNSTKLNSKKLIYETYDSLPILSLRRVPLQGFNLFFKRLIDIIISLAVIVFVVMANSLFRLFIKKESDGPVFFSQITQWI